ncbi:MAG: DJ-1/PfpI family protein [Acidimicrobiales bacterium]
MPGTIGMLLFPDVDELDVAGPWEVLTLWTRLRPDDRWRVISVGTAGAGPVRCAGGLVMTPDTALAAAGPMDVVIEPGGNGINRLMQDEVHLGWLREQAARSHIMSSVCVGALVLATAGVLHNHRATTHWMNLEQLAEIDSTIDVLADVGYVDDGPVVTSAGVSAGIEMALHLVGRLGGADRAEDVRRLIQYDCAPRV